MPVESGVAIAFARQIDAVAKEKGTEAAEEFQAVG